MPDDFVETMDQYRDEGAVIFEGIDYFQIWVMLMLKRHDWIADRFVDLQDEKRSKQEIVAFMRQRLKPVTISA